MELPELRRAARGAGLRYVRADEPGIRRLRNGRGFRYVGPNGKTIRDSRQLDRIRKLAIPPAWREVWICRHHNGHLQTVGLDARGRRQYRYHAAWTKTRNQVKFDQMLAFARALPAIRRRVRRDLARKGMPKERVIACIVRLMDQTLLRVGNNEYARQNGSYGLTTVQRKHVTVNGSTIRFKFKGKSGQKTEATIDDPRAARVVRQCQELPGQEVFEYVGTDGRSHDVRSEHVNEYLYRVTDERFTAKDFRTWAGTVIAAAALHACASSSGRERRGQKIRNGISGRGRRAKRACDQHCVEAVKKAAAALGNRASTCRKFYIHPQLADCYANGLLERAFRASRRGAKSALLSKDERAVVRLISMINGR